MTLFPKNLISWSGRNPHEVHRTATTLELFFDLVYVVAIASATGGFHHFLQDHQVVEGMGWYGLSFFAIWWSWMNFTWYASAYDTDDFWFRIIAFIQIFGSLVMAVGVGSIFKPVHELSVSITGYVIMRLAMAINWFRAAKLDKARRTTCIRYAVGIILVQLGWVANYLWSDKGLAGTRILILVLAELAVPFIAETTKGGSNTPWHPHHIAERYGLFIIIVLGEGILGTTNSIAALIDNSTLWYFAFPVGLGAAALIFALWWSYFRIPWANILHRSNHSARVAFIFGYGHYFLFTSLAAVGVGLSLVADAAEIGSGVAKTTPNFAMQVTNAATCLFLLLLCFYRTTMLPRTKLVIWNWVICLLLPWLPHFALSAGLPLHWAILLAVVAPAAFVFINSWDECVNPRLAEHKEQAAH